jgi:hypothetical protein
MKKVLYPLLPLILVFALTSLVYGQDKADRPSPPAQVTGTVGDATISVSYSSPAVKERAIWGDLVPYNKVWRTGANEATVFETSADITINGSSLPAGKYSLFTVPGEETWTVIFNSDPDQWGSYKYDKAKDVLRVEATPGEASFKERLEFAIEGNEVVFMWERLRLPLVIK